MKLSVFLSFVSCVSFTFLFAHHNIPTKQDFYSKTIEETDSILGHSLRQINSKNPEELGKSLASFLSICDSIQCLKNKKVVLRYRAKALSKQGELEALYGGLQEAKTIFIEAFQISQQLNDSSLISQNSIDLGYTLLYQGQRDSAIHYFNQAFTIDSLMQDSVGLISYWTNISSVYRDDGNIKKVLELSFKAMDYALALNEEQLLGVIYNTLGVCYIDQNNPHKALEYLNLSYEIAIKHEDYFNAANLMICLGAQFFEIGDTVQGIEYMNKGIAHSIKHNIPYVQASANAYLANYYGKKNELDSAILFYDQALVLMRKIGDRQGEIKSLKGLANVYHNKKQYKQALRYAKEAEVLCIDSISTLRIQEALYNIYKGLGDYKKAMDYHEKWSTLNLAIINNENKIALAEAHLMMEHNKEKRLLKQEKALLQLKVKHQKQEQRLTLSVIGVSIVLLSFLVYSIIRRKRNLQQFEFEKRIINTNLDKLKLEQRLLLTQMNPHFMFNALNSISAFISKNNTVEARYFLAKFAKIMRQILDASRKTSITLEDELSILENYVQLECLRSGKRFEYQINVSTPIKNSLEQFSIPPMLLQPFVENAIKHGLDNLDSKGHLSINLKTVDQNYLCIEIIDNGIGFEKAKELKEKLKLHKSVAMEITKDRLEGYNRNHRLPIEIMIDDLTLRNSKGTKVIVMLPIAA